MEIVFILVHPAVPENMGFSLRALKTMGFSALRIVGKVDLSASGFRKTAYASHDLIPTIQVYHQLDDALKDIDLSIGTTSKKRTTRKDILEASQLKNFLSDRTRLLNRVAIVFGSEESGLSKADIDLCNVVSTIPIHTSYPSLNLAQSVLIYAYELASIPNKNTRTERKAEQNMNQIMLEKSEEIFTWLELDQKPAFLRRLKDRMSLAGTVDTRLILSILKKLSRKKSN